MRVGELLYRLDQAGIMLTCFSGEGELNDRLNAKPTSALTPELIEEIREHKQAIVQIMCEDAAYQRTGILQSERQVFDLAREFFGLNERGGAA
jgi:hypothetical protein